MTEEKRGRGERGLRILGCGLVLVRPSNVVKKEETAARHEATHTMRKARNECDSMTESMDDQEQGAKRRAHTTERSSHDVHTKLLTGPHELTKAAHGQETRPQDDKKRRACT
jgi:hypothetical protein